MVEHRSPKPGVGSSSLSSRANIFEMKKIVAYFKETYDELVHKVSWPTYSELTNSAVVVLYASLLIALVVFAMDFCFQHLMEFVYPHLKKKEKCLRLKKKWYVLRAISG